MSAGGASGAAGHNMMGGATAATRPMTPVSDRQFVQMATASGNAEIAEARIALQRSKDPVVRQFAQRMIDDHSRAAVALRTAARPGHFTASANLMQPQERRQIARLNTLTGPRFNTAYMREQLPDHQQAVALFTYESQKGKDPSLKAYAAQTLPTLQAHLQMASAYKVSGGTTAASNSMSRGVGGSTSMPGSSGVSNSGSHAALPQGAPGATATATPAGTRSTNSGTTTTNTPNNPAASPAAH